MSLLSSLLVLIVAARLFGRLFARFNQPEIIGEILAGLLLGPTLLDVIRPNPSLAGVSELAVFLLILAAGLEMQIGDIVGAMRGRGMVLAVIGFGLPFVAGVAAGQAFGLDVMRTVFLGLCISITALPVAVRLLESMQLLNTRIGRHAIATAVVNDVAALLVLGVVLAVPAQPSFNAVAITFAGSLVKLSLLAAFVLALNRGLELLERRHAGLQLLVEKLVRYFGAEALFGIVVLFVLVFGSVSEMLGFHFVIGAFFGALLLDKRHFLASRYQELKSTLGSVTSGFLTPVFFAHLGVEFNLHAIDSLVFVAAVIGLSIATKIAAGWCGGLIVGMSRREALGLGCILNGRGVMELVVASIAYQKGFIDAGLFSTLVLMGMLTTFITPILFNRVLPPERLAGYRSTGSA